MTNYNSVEALYIRGENLLASLTNELSSQIIDVPNIHPAALPIYRASDSPLGIIHPRPVVHMYNGLNGSEIDAEFSNMLVYPSRESHYTGPKQDLARQWGNLVGIKHYYLAPFHQHRLQNCRDVFLNTWNINIRSDEEILNEIEEVHRFQAWTAAHFLGLLGNTHNCNVSLSGSVGQKTSLKSSDYDFATAVDMGAMHDYVKPTRQAFHCFQIENCWGMKRANARLQLLHMTCVDNENREYNIDFVCQSHTNILAGEVAALPLVERCSIIAAKLFFKKMRLIEKQRLTSSAFAVAYLCYTKDHTILERSFARFMAYFANFDFREFRMTTNGPELKQTHDLAYEALDLYSNAATGLTYNTLGGTVPEAMDIAKEWMHFLASIPHIDRIILSMF